MHRPISHLTPSEGTIEQLSNHFLLNMIGPDSSWFYVPTKNDEKLLGYDASIQANKVLVIQYKRLNPYKFGGGSIRISQSQHKTLKRNFPRKPLPYVFYAFSLYPNYRELNLPFSRSQGAMFGSSMVFIDAHSISNKSKSISTNKLNGKGCRSYCLSSVAQLFLSCKVGLRIDQDSTFSISDSGLSKNPGRINLLWARIP